MTIALIYLWVSLATACVADFHAGTDTKGMTKFLSGILVAIIGPPTFPIFIFMHILRVCEASK